MSAKARSFTYRIANWLLSVRLSVIAAPRMSISPRGSLLLDASSWDLKYKRAQSLSSYMYQYLRLTFSLPRAVKNLIKNYLVALKNTDLKNFTEYWMFYSFGQGKQFQRHSWKWDSYLPQDDSTDTQRDCASQPLWCFSLRNLLFVFVLRPFLQGRSGT